MRDRETRPNLGLKVSIYDQSLHSNACTHNTHGALIAQTDPEEKEEQEEQEEQKERSERSEHSEQLDTPAKQRKKRQTMSHERKTLMSIIRRVQ